jgi:hypothetical protein
VGAIGVFDTTYDPCNPGCPPCAGVMFTAT